jgi:hypothetical protein
MANAIWEQWSNAKERGLLESYRQFEIAMSAERKKIRDRCYQRARRAKAVDALLPTAEDVRGLLKESVKP